MRCPQCQTELPDDAQFCNKCGNKLELTCPACRKTNPPGSNFCLKCGHDLRKPKEAPSIDYQQPRSYTPKHLADKILSNRIAIEGERKLVTILFADVADSAAMFEDLDPEQVHEVMDGCFRILMDEIHRYEGTINQFTGDGVMALFGAPIAHEDHAQRACYASLAIQESLRPYAERLKTEHGIHFTMRVGLNSGSVVVGAIGDDLRMDYTAQGDTANLAARMESNAEPGTVLASEHTYKLAGGFFDFEPLDEIQVKGKAEGVKAYRLVKPGEATTRIEAAAAKGLTRFVGRKRQLETLKEAFEKAQSGEGQVVGVVGEAGVGKSRLLLEFRNSLPKKEYLYLEGRCLHYGSSMPYLPILDALRTYLGIKEGEKESVIKQKMLERIVGSDETLTRCLPPVQELFSLKVDDEGFAKLDPRHKRERTFEALRDILIRGSLSRPIVWAFEDLHWIDRTTEEFLEYMIGWLPGARILLILLYRPEYTHQWGSKSYYSKVGVGQLSSGTSAELVQAILEGGAVVPELRELILSRAAGNPLFLEELTHSLLENGSVQKKADQYVLARTDAEIRIPDTIQGIIAARMDRLDEGLKRIMQVASVIGREFAFRILQAIIEMKEDLKSNLLNLQGLEFISEKSLFPELEYIFKHALIQEVAYETLLQRRRKEIHEEIGKAIETVYADRLEEYYELLAYHYGKSGNAEKAVEYLDLANQKAIKIYALEEAMDFFAQVIKFLDTLPETKDNQERRISVIANQVMVFLLLFKLPEYYEYLTRWETLAVSLGNRAQLSAWYARMGHCEWSFGRYDQAKQSLNRAVELAAASGAQEEAGYAHMLLAWNHLCTGECSDVLKSKEKAVQMLQHRFNLRSYVWSLTPLSWAYTNSGLWDLAVQESRTALSTAEEYADRSLSSFASWITSIAYSFKGDMVRAVEWGEQAVNKAATLADKAWSHCMFGLALCRAGQATKAVEILDRFEPVMLAARWVIVEVQFMTTQGEAHWRFGAYDKASKCLEHAAGLAGRTGMRYWSGWANRLLGEIALETDPVTAPPHFEKSIATLQEIAAENELALAYAGYGRYHKQEGNIGQAKEYLVKALEIFERLETLIEPDKVREELAGLPDAVQA